jgi:hypothetical protein
MVKFKVNDVHLDLEWWANAQMTVDGAEQAKQLARAKPVEGFSHRGATFINNYYSVKNPLIAAVYLSFSAHFPLILSPDVIWNTILQGVSTHVSKDPEKHRHAFVSHAGKDTITSWTTVSARAIRATTGAPSRAASRTRSPRP